VLLFKEPYESSTKLLEYLARKPTYFINKIIEQALMNMNNNNPRVAQDKIV
jgi:hypothetical protein